MRGATVYRFIRMAALVFAAAIATPSAADKSSEVVAVMLDHATILRLERQASTVVVGNPSIADAMVQNGTLLVLTGKSYGRTNLVILDASGQEIAAKIVDVGVPRDVVTVQRGAQRHSYNCRTRCEGMMMLGDAPEPFNAINAQVGARQGLAQSSSGH